MNSNDFKNSKFQHLFITGGAAVRMLADYVDTAKKNKKLFY